MDMKLEKELLIEDFGELLSDKIKEKLGDDFIVESKSVLKNNGAVYHAVMIKKKGDAIAPTIYTEELFKEYNKSRDVDELANMVISLYSESLEKQDFDIDFFMDFSKVCECLSFKAVNLKENEKKLKDIPFKQIEDLALIPICLLRSETLGGGVVSITKRHLEIWEVSEEELWENAFENSEKVRPSKVTGIEEYISMRTGVKMDNLLSRLLIVSNEELSDGAGVVFYPGLLNKVSMRLDSDLILIPSSINEMIVMPYCEEMGDAVWIKNMVKEVNRTVVADEEVLSDNIYFYNSKDDKISIF